jgi:hypothetical protein
LYLLLLQHQALLQAAAAAAVAAGVSTFASCFAVAHCAAAAATALWLDLRLLHHQQLASRQLLQQPWLL